MHGYGYGYGYGQSNGDGHSNPALVVLAEAVAKPLTEIDDAVRVRADMGLPRSAELARMSAREREEVVDRVRRMIAREVWGAMEARGGRREEAW